MAQSGTEHDTITLTLDGKPSMREFVVAAQSFWKIIEGLTREVAHDAEIDWELDDLDFSSAVMSGRGVSKRHPEAVERVVSAYEEMGQQLERGMPIPYSEDVSRAARMMISIINGRVPSVRLNTRRGEYQIDSPKSVPSVWRAPSRYGRETFGAVRGRIESMSRRGRLSFTLYDLIYDRGVLCYVAPSEENTMREIWGKLAIVEGVVSRDYRTGAPTSIRNVRRIELIDEPARTSYRAAVGCVEPAQGRGLPEDTIRKARDAE